MAIVSCFEGSWLQRKVFEPRNRRCDQRTKQEEHGCWHCADEPSVSKSQSPGSFEARMLEECKSTEEPKDEFGRRELDFSPCMGPSASYGRRENGRESTLHQTFIPRCRRPSIERAVLTSQIGAFGSGDAPVTSDIFRIQWK